MNCLKPVEKLIMIIDNFYPEYLLQNQSIILGHIIKKKSKIDDSAVILAISCGGVVTGGYQKAVDYCIHKKYTMLIRFFKLLCERNSEIEVHNEFMKTLGR
jgi:hypothetical protein